MDFPKSRMGRKSLPWSVLAWFWEVLFFIVVVDSLFAVELRPLVRETSLKQGIREVDT